MNQAGRREPRWRFKSDTATNVARIWFQYTNSTYVQNLPQLYMLEL